MSAAVTRSPRRLPDGTALHNRLLTALPRTDYDRGLDLEPLWTDPDPEARPARSRPHASVTASYAHISSVSDCDADDPWRRRQHGQF
jgi:hypothetical protein